MYEINYSKSSAKFLKKLPKEKQKHILSVIERARIRPEIHFERLVGKKVYNIYKSKIRQGIKTINELLNYRKRYVHYPNPETNGMIINSINSNKEYFHRLIVILDEMFNDNKLDSLIQEIELEKTDLL